MLDLFVTWKDRSDRHERHIPCQVRRNATCWKLRNLNLSFRGNAGGSSSCIPKGCRLIWGINTSIKIVTHHPYGYNTVYVDSENVLRAVQPCIACKGDFSSLCQPGPFTKPELD